ncbi:tRNA (adenosine(37)-N6)-dimethylallyltransferase MiaA [Campylobacter sp. MIT 99-7217]|uniref:tRNA (adenosine(37)-N6)-dimethylallyltransferase MiaA n=1 Tax=Campylobacter sp. MIT 99-7217 TaxID=535091 RepID=UPI00115B537E|nr:tRNA (adenosine(37)-N6)-dimethylallyltransferase MiaA [Campylobacter sp. MIT 99-7217]TQR30962.1 tRNA (adenosine(37)-N6)-dimethylallyltransferase MiaA [Campylobacter sp. MIT 99-7217]
MFFEFAIIGTTASGKTALANALAYEFEAVILSLDSLLVYKQINIASAKMDSKILEELDIFGVNLLDIDEHFSVGLFFKEYQKAKEFAQKKDKALIITGGTSFYLKALLSGLSEDLPFVKSDLSNEAIYELMQNYDANANIAKNDTYRLQKWHSIYIQTKQAPSKFLKNTTKAPLIKELEIFDLTWEKEELKKNIQKRTQDMLKKGLIEEARTLFSRYDPSLKPLNSIGLKECKDFLDQKISKDELEALINTHTAQLAKRQRTFNKKFIKNDLNKDKALDKLRSYMKLKLDL